MSAPDFYFANNAMFRHIHDRFCKAALVAYWRGLGRDYYRQRTDAWREGGPGAVAKDWRAYFDKEPLSTVAVSVDNAGAVTLDISVCPAIRHLRESGRDIVPYFCEHCDHIGSAMGENAGYTFERTGGMGACVQRFVPLTVSPATQPKGRA